MIGLLIITHETVGEAYQGLTYHSFPSGFPENARIFGVQPNEDQNDITNNAIIALQEFPDNRGVSTVTDIFGATPYNVARRLVRESKSVILTGPNTLITIEAIQYSSQAENLSDFTETVREAAIRGVFATTSALEDLAYKGDG